MQKVKKKITNKKIFIIIIIVIACLTYVLLRSCSKDAGLVYRYEKASIGEVKKTISTSGSLEILNSHLILSKISGLVTNVYADYNDPVKKNQLLAALDTTEIDQEIIKIDSKRESIAFELLAAKRDVNAKKDMLKDNLIASKNLELAQLQLKQIETQMKQIQNEYEIAKRNKNYTKILSPAAGVIIAKDIQPGVPITQNKVLFTIAEDLKKMQLIIQVDESDIGYIKNDQNVMFTVSAFPEKTFKGSIVQVRLNPIKKEQLVSYQAIVACDNKELLLKPGMTATATVEVAVRKNVLRVPSEAFIVSPVEASHNAGKKCLWKKHTLAMDSLPLKKIEVKIGLTGDYFTEIITKDIKEGDEILVGVNKGGSEIK
ncbi:MAG: efflux RND transporter periplasmic adaptor subunit [Spirochaetes bacterium]|nr:efflux RND transporter periplasmic adaptor subunit [Spirochaetota bacterium]